MAQKYFDDPHGIWLRENRFKYGKKGAREKLRQDFNKTFNLDTSFRQFRDLLCQFVPQGIKRTYFSIEELEWTKENYKKYSDRESFTKEFEEKFNRELNLSNFTNLFYVKLKINFGNVKNTKVYNFYKSKLFPIGHEMKIHGKIWVKINDIPRARETINYRPKSHIKYEEYFNVKVDDKTQRVVQINEDINDFSKENLMLLEINEFKTYNCKRTYYPIKLNKYLLNMIKLEYIIKNEGKE